MMRTVIVLSALSSLLGACATLRPAFPPGRVVDLSHPYDEQTIFWPTEQGFQLEKGFAGVTEKGYYYASNKFCAPEHGGTHLDAPIHFAEGQRTVDQIPPEQLMGPAVVVDVSRQSEQDPDYQVTVEDLTGWEKEHGRTLDGTILLLRTGFGARWPDRKRYLGTDERGAEAVAKLHFPGLSPEAARWLVENRSIKAVGLDTASIDRGQSTLFESHQILFKKNIPALENLANLHLLPAKDFVVIALPMKIAGGSGGPVRVVAITQ